MLLRFAPPLAIGLGLLAAAALSAAERQTPLLAVSQGQRPNDTGSEGATTFALEEVEGLSGRALRVAFADGDSFGNKGIGPKDWRTFTAIEFDVLNPGRSAVTLTFTVRHAGTTSFPTRVDRPLEFQPGANHVVLKLAELLNNGGSKPDFSAVSHWYFAAASGESPTLYFGDIRLTGGTGAEPAPSPSARRSTDDPARLARLRAAKMPRISGPVMFNTPEADAICAALEVFPPDNAFNQVVADWPVHPNSRAIIASIGGDKPLRYNPDMAFILVPPDQPQVDVRIVDYGGESDPGPYPVPDNTPIEGWPAGFRQFEDRVPSLAEVQKRPPEYIGDRHAIVVDPVGRKLYEFFTMGKTPDGWAADQASLFDLSSNDLRPDGWTSADAAGLPIFPAVVRHDELERGAIEHALRVTVRRTRRAYVAPATHFASRLDDPDLPRMGERIRLRGDFDTSTFSPPVRTILEGLKKYGMFVADNGLDWAISVTPDERIPVMHEELRKVQGADFEVVTAPE